MDIYPCVLCDWNVKKGNGFPSDLLPVLLPMLSRHLFLFFRTVGTIEMEGIGSSSNREKSETVKVGNSETLLLKQTNIFKLSS